MSNLFWRAAILPPVLSLVFLTQTVQAQTITISGGSTAGQQTLSADQSILVENGGSVLEIDHTAIDGSGDNISMTIDGNAGVDLSSISPILPIASASITGNDGFISGEGSINFEISSTAPSNTLSGVIGLQSAIRTEGDRNEIVVSNELRASVAATPDIASCVIGVCQATAEGNEVEAAHGIAIIGNFNTVRNDGSLTTTIGRAVVSASGTILLSGHQNLLENDGVVSMDILLDATQSKFDPISGRWQAPVAGINEIFHSGIVVYGTDHTIRNLEDGLIQATDSRQFGSGAAVDAFTTNAIGTIVENRGKIVAENLGIGVVSGQVENRGSITVNGPSALAGIGAGVYLKDSTLNNFASIISNSDGVGIGNPLGFGGAADSLVMNQGIIHGYLNGLIVQSGTGTVDNSGVISGNVSGIRVGTASVVGQLKLDLINSGLVEGQSHGIYSANHDIKIANLGEIFGQTYGIRGGLIDSSAILANSGLIHGENGIYGSFELDLLNSGKIISTDGPAGHAIYLQPGDFPDPLGNGFVNFLSSLDDTIEFGAGTRIIGRMNLGDDSLFANPLHSPNGNDTVVLNRTERDISWRWTFDRFDLPGTDPIDQSNFGDSLFIIGDNIPYYVWNGPVTGDYGAFPAQDGITVFIPNLSEHYVVTGILEDITRSVHGSVRNQIDANWDNRIWTTHKNAATTDSSSSPPSFSTERSESSAAKGLVSPYSFWLTGFGGERSEYGSKRIDAYSHLWTGGLAGGEFQLIGKGHEADTQAESNSELRVGLLGGLANSELSFENSATDIETEFYFGGAYAQTTHKNWFANVSVIAGYGQNDVAKPIANNLVPGGIEQGTDYDASLKFISPSASIGRAFSLSSSTVFTPEANLTYLAQWFEGAEDAQGVSVDDRFAASVFGHVQASLRHFSEFENALLTTEIRAGIHANKQLNTDAVDITVVSNPFTIDVSNTDLVSPYVGIGAKLEIGEKIAISADLEIDFGDLDGGRAHIAGHLGF